MSLDSIKKYNSLVLYTQGYHNSSGNELNNLVIQLFLTYTLTYNFHPPLHNHCLVVTKYLKEFVKKA